MIDILVALGTLGAVATAYLVAILAVDYLVNGRE